MLRSLQRLLAAIAGLLVLADLAWGLPGGFRVDLWAYGRIALLAGALTAAGLFYHYRRGEPALAAMMLGASFLCVFSAAASMLNYFFLTFHGPRMDAALAAGDRALGFDWVAVMTAMTAHPLLDRVLRFAYDMVLPEIALMVVVLGWRENADKVYRFCIAVAAGALIAIAVWAVAPSVGTQALFTLPPAVAAKLNLAVQADYGIELNRLLRYGPGLISPAELRGLIAFPSYHGMLALIVAWYARGVPRLFWPLLLLNLLVLVATPVQGGHHLVDVLASFPAAALALFIAARAVQAPKPSAMVNERRIFTIRPVPQGLFRISATQNSAAPPNAIKSKLSGVS